MKYEMHGLAAQPVFDTLSSACLSMCDEKAHVLVEHSARNVCTSPMTVADGALLTGLTEYNNCQIDPSYIGNPHQIKRERRIASMHGYRSACEVADWRPVGVPQDFPFVPDVTSERRSKVRLGPFMAEGGFAKIYRGRYGPTEVAVKVINTDPERGTTTTESAFAEAVLSKRLLHPNIVTTLDYFNVPSKREAPSSPRSVLPPSSSTGTEGESSTRPQEMWIIQELCDKGTMYTAMKSGCIPRVSSSTEFGSMLSLLQTALDVASALQYLHSLGITHGDLSGNNVLLKTDANERGWKALVCDFGLSTTTNADASSSQGRPANLGTISAMAPEMIRGGLMTPKADVWSFGVLLYEMFCGERAYEGCCSAQVVFRVGTLGEALELPEDAPCHFRSLFTACMDPDFNKRPSFHEIVYMLNNMIATHARE